MWRFLDRKPLETLIHSARLNWTSVRVIAEEAIYTTQKNLNTILFIFSIIENRTGNPSNETVSDQHLSPHGLHVRGSRIKFFHFIRADQLT
jgi:hypothetical protein